MRLLRLTPGGQFADLPMRSPGAPACSPDAPSACNASRQDWAVLLQLKPTQQLALLPPAMPMAPTTMSQPQPEPQRSEEHTSELQSLMRISYAVFCFQQKKHDTRDYSNIKHLLL